MEWQRLIYLNFTLYKPSWWNRFENVKNWHGSMPIAHKYWEVEIIKHRNLIKFVFEWSIKQDHAGIKLELGLLGYEIIFTVYDHRHWDTNTNTWRQYD
jgi:hypothetical protein